ncbi:MAG: hypothetical protein M3252_00155 [Actinomycetota bacterium]|nr:hypothetical protein [Actinomycetota bacterium]
MAYDPHPHEHREREIIVERGRGGPGAVIAAIVAIVVLALLVWFLFTNVFRGQGSESEVDLPERVDVNVDEQGGQGVGSQSR